MLFWVTLQTNRSQSWRLFPLHSPINYIVVGDSYISNSSIILLF